VSDALDPEALFESLLAEQEARKLPPVDRWAPTREARIDMRIGRDGVWSYQGSPIRREAMIRLFSTILRREEDRYFLTTPVEKLEIEVEDAPFLAVSMERAGEGDAQRLLFTTNVGDHVLADADHPIRVDDRDGEPAPYVLVRDGLWALITRNLFYRLVDLAQAPQDDPRTLCVRSSGEAFVLGRV
jgi:hypothetical protein